MIGGDGVELNTPLLSAKDLILLNSTMVFTVIMKYITSTHNDTENNHSNGMAIYKRAKSFIPLNIDSSECAPFSSTIKSAFK